MSPFWTRPTCGVRDFRGGEGGGDEGNGQNVRHTLTHISLPKFRVPKAHALCAFRCRDRRQGPRERWEGCGQRGRGMGGPCGAPQCAPVASALPLWERAGSVASVAWIVTPEAGCWPKWQETGPTGGAALDVYVCRVVQPRESHDHISIAPVHTPRPSLLLRPVPLLTLSLRVLPLLLCWKPLLPMTNPTQMGFWFWFWFTRAISRQGCCGLGGPESHPNRSSPSARRLHALRVGAGVCYGVSPVWVWCAVAPGAGLWVRGRFFRVGGGGGCSRALRPWGSPLARPRSDHPDPPPMGLTSLSLGTATSHDTYEGTERHRSIELRHGVIMVRRQDPSQPRRHHLPHRRRSGVTPTQYYSSS